MKRLISLWFASLMLFASLAEAAVQTFTNDTTTTYYYNSGNTFDSPPIDAINFVNNGAFIVTNGLNFLSGISLPFETSDTQNYTNTGTMQTALGFSAGTGIIFSGSTFFNLSFGSVGFRFRDNPASVGMPRMSRSFYNAINADIQADTLLAVWATNIVNRGLLRVSAAGVMDLTGGSVDLTESLLEVPSLSSVISLSSFPILTNYFLPAAGVYDVAWSTTNLARFTRQINLNTLWGSFFGGTNATAPSIFGAPPPSQAVAGFTIPEAGSSLVSDSEVTLLGSSSITLTNFDLASFTNITVASNVMKQAVFVGVPPAMNAQINFSGADDGKTVTVMLSMVSTNPITLEVVTNYIGFEDTLASQPGGRLLQNLDAGTYRPTNYDVGRFGNFPLLFGTNNGNAGMPNTNFFLSSGNVEVFTNFASFIQSEFPTNTVVTNGTYSAYTAFLDNVVSRPPNVSGGTFTNLPGSIRITADKLDLGETRMTAQGQISIHANHLVSSSNAVVDCDNLSFDLGSTNGSLVIKDLIPVTVSGRMRGTIKAWSGLWTNAVTVVLTNNFGLNAQGITAPVPVTNTTTVVYHALILDASGLADSLGTFVYDLIAHADSVHLEDDVTLAQDMLFDTRALTLDGSINVPGYFPISPLTGTSAPGTPLTDWVNTNAPRLLYLTNNGTITMPSTVHFGDDRPRYYTVVNGGTINAASIQANSIYLENHGTFSSRGLIDLQFGNALLTNGFSYSSNYTRLTGNNLALNQYQITALGSVDFSVATILTDGGVASYITNNGGVNLRAKPVAGDLLATTITEYAPRLTSSTIPHRWAAEDRGPVVEGFVDNAALGKLILTAAAPQAKFQFLGTGSANALYVDQLELGSTVGNVDGQGNLTNILIGPNLKIYYGDVTIDGVSVAEKLNGKNNGRFIWVSNYAGTFSGTDLNYGGTTYRFNRALVESQNFDSDNDGTVNLFDPTPIPSDLAFTNIASAISFPALPFPADNESGVGTGFAGAKGLYHGLFYQAEGVSPDSSGYFSATTTDKGRFSAKIQLSGQMRSFSGQFDNSGRWTNDVPSLGLTVELQLDLNGGNQIRGRVISADWTADLLADRAVFNKRSNPALQAGKYTVVIQGNPNDTNSPAGHGFGTATVDVNGNVKWAGTLSDGTKVSQKSVLSSQGIWPLYSGLYHGMGLLVGWVQFSDQIESDLAGQTLWIKPDSVGGALYPAGFTNDTMTIGSRYTRFTGLTNGVAVFTDGNLSASFTNSFVLKGGKASNQGTNKFTLNLNPSTGLFKGNVLDPDGNKIPFQGAWLKKAGFGEGFFLGTDQSGQVLLDPTP